MFRISDVWKVVVCLKAAQSLGWDVGILCSYPPIPVWADMRGYAIFSVDSNTGYKIEIQPMRKRRAVRNR